MAAEARERKANQSSLKEHRKTRRQPITQQHSFRYNSRVISTARCATRAARNDAAAVVNSNAKPEQHTATRRGHAHATAIRIDAADARATQ